MLYITSTDPVVFQFTKPICSFLGSLMRRRPRADLVGPRPPLRLWAESHVLLHSAAWCYLRRKTEPSVFPGASDPQFQPLQVPVTL